MGEIAQPEDIASRDRLGIARSAGNPAGRIGDNDELLTRGPNVMLGYWGEGSPGRWMHTGDIATMDEAGYVRMLQSLVQGPQVQPRDIPPQGRQFLETNQFSPSDVVGLAAAAPRELTSEDVALLGQILRLALDAGHQLGGKDLALYAGNLQCRPQHLVQAANPFLDRCFHVLQKLPEHLLVVEQWFQADRRSPHGRIGQRFAPDFDGKPLPTVSFRSNI
mgnify:CR=1 FL=1